MKTELNIKNMIFRKINQRRILIFLFVVIFIVAAISMVLMLMNDGDVKSEGDIINQTNGSSSGIHSMSLYSTNIVSSMNTGISSMKSSAVVSSEYNDSQNGEYLPLIIEPAKTKQVITTTIEYFKQQLPSLRQALDMSGFYYSEKLLDPNTSTTAFILAINENYAQNLNGYFYYLIDEKGSATIVSPFVLNISILFDEENRQEVIESGCYAESEHLTALKNSLSAALGKYYSDEVFNFIFSEYKRTFKARIDGELIQNPVVKLQFSNLEVIFHNSFLTYVEFFIIQ